MTHQIYSHQQLRLKSIARLKQIYSEISCKVEVADKRCKSLWINAIIEHQASKIHKIDEQTQAQLELDGYITAQANIIAPQPLTKLEITFYHHEVYAGEELIAVITYDKSEFTTQPWLVIVDGVENTTPARCDRYVEWHYKDGTLRETCPTPLEFPEISPEVQEEFVNRELLTGNREQGLPVMEGCYPHQGLPSTSGGLRPIGKEREQMDELLPVARSLFPLPKGVDDCHSFKQQHQPRTISEEITVQIARECRKYGFKLCNGKDIYKNHIKIGEVSYTDNNWWVLSATQPNQKRLLCDSLSDAVWWLSTRNFQPTPIPYRQQILCKPLEQLTSADWRWLQQHEITTQLVAV